MSRLRMRGAIPPLPNTPSWRGTQLSIGTSPLPSYIEKNNVLNTLLFADDQVLFSNPEDD
jgi:hypothetical protein